MPFQIKLMIIIPVFYFLARRSFHRLWKGGLIGVAIMMVADYIGYRLNLFVYQNELLIIGGYLPVSNIISVFLSSMLFLKWLPERWDRRILYILYVSVLFLAVEAMVFNAGGIIYPNWSLVHSYFLLIGGLSLLAYLSDFAGNQRHIKSKF